jgi:hypothetical protein
MTARWPGCQVCGVDFARPVSYRWRNVRRAVSLRARGDVSDHEAYSSLTSLGSAGLRSIEQVLAGLLEEFPVTAGFDIVFATIPAAAEAWPAGLRADYYLRECHARARRTALDEGLRHVWYLRS